jgi:phage repressor protein C with HTH and peptisase S24 domain
VVNNLKALRLTTGLTQEDFGAQFGVKKTTYSGYEKGSSDPPSSFFLEVADKYHVSVDWLLGFADDPHRTKYAAMSRFEEKYYALDDYGRRLVDAVMQIENERARQPQENAVVDLGLIRHYLYSPAAGPGGLISGSDYEDIPRTAEMPSGADYCLTVSGDSMEPYIHDGQMIFVSEDGEVQQMDVGVWYYQGGTYVKQYAVAPDGTVHLLSANPDRRNTNLQVPPEAVSWLVCFGKVIGIKKLPPPPYW